MTHERAPQTKQPRWCGTGAASRLSHGPGLQPGVGRLARQNPTIEGAEASNAQAIHLSQLGHLWKEVSARSLGLRYRPKGLPCCCRYCVLRLCAPQRYRGAFFWLAQKEKPLASVREGACQGLRSVQGHEVTEPHRKRKLRRLTVAECATNPPLVRSYLDARVARRLPQAALYGPTAVKAVPSLPVP